jgi:hypothetical protein
MFRRRDLLIAALMLLIHRVALQPCHSQEERKAFTNRISAEQSLSATKILLIGNSLIYVGDLPVVFQALLHDSERKIQLKLSEVGGPSYKLSEHIAAKQALAELESNQPWDVVVIQESSGIVLNQPEESFESAGAFANAARSINAKPLFYETWNDDVEAGYSNVHRNAKKIADVMRCELLPVGTAMYYARKAIPRINLFSDRHHLGPIGQYLAACVLYGKVTGQSPVGLATSLRSIGLDLPPEIAHKLQEAASESLKSEPQSANAATPAVVKAGSLRVASPASATSGSTGRASSFKEIKVLKSLSSRVKITAIMGDIVMFEVDGVALRLKPGMQHKALKLISVEGNAVRFSENGVECTKKLY